MITMQSPNQETARTAPYRGLLRDGTSVMIRPSVGSDRSKIIAFFEHLSPDSLRKRFLSSAFPADGTISQICDSSNPRNALSLVVTIQEAGLEKIVGIGSYYRSNDSSAEISFSVGDELQGRGAGTLLLEQLAVSALHYGFKKFWAVTSTSNAAMMDVFTHSGFQLKETTDHGDVEMELDLKPTEHALCESESRERIATTASLRNFFRPSSVVVVGASRDPANFGRRILHSIVENKFNGEIAAVNPNADEVLGIRCYHSVKDLPHAYDLAIIVVPRDHVLEVVDECAAKEIRSVVVISAGFAESGPTGRDLQDRLTQKIRHLGMRMIGPNCMGVFNSDPETSLSATFAEHLPPAGSVAMMSQSGALGLAVLEVARRTNLGMSMFVSVGNKADISGNDLLQYWESDPNVSAVLLYLESFGNPKKFARIARRVSRTKPIVAIKSGRSSAGQRAAGSHTAALAANTTASDALFEQCGIIRANDLEEMFDLAQALASQPLPLGKRVGIVTNAGGPGILCVDACEANGLFVPEYSAKVQAELSRHLPAAAGIKNPIDMIASASPEQFGKAIETVLTSGEVDSLIVIYVPVIAELSGATMDSIATAVHNARQQIPVPVPVLACIMSESLAHKKFCEGENRIPTYLFPESPAKVLAKLCHYRDWRDRPAGELIEFEDLDVNGIADICRAAAKTGEMTWLSAADTRRVLELAKLATPRGGFAESSERATELADQIGYPVAVKLASRTITHKSEVGGVRLNLMNANQVQTAYDQIKSELRARGEDNAMDGVVVQAMISEGAELMIGMTNDPLFGPLLAFGLGGTHVEILRDIVFRVTPITTTQATEMIRSIRGYPLLQGFRGHPKADVKALETILLRLSQLVQKVPQIAELDFNPVIARPEGDGCLILDARIRVRAETTDTGK